MKTYDWTIVWHYRTGKEYHESAESFEEVLQFLRDSMALQKDRDYVERIELVPNR